jgi:hypothetical protein
MPVLPRQRHSHSCGFQFLLHHYPLPAIVATWYGGSNESPKNKPIFAPFAPLREAKELPEFGITRCRHDLRKRPTKIVFSSYGHLAFVLMNT